MFAGYIVYTFNKVTRLYVAHTVYSVNIKNITFVTFVGGCMRIEMNSQAPAQDLEMHV